MREREGHFEILLPAQGRRGFVEIAFLNFAFERVAAECEKALIQGCAGAQALPYQ